MIMSNDTEPSFVSKLPSMARYWIFAGAVLAGLAGVSGAFGAHSLEAWLTETYDDSQKRISNWETASRYQIYHSIAIIFVGILWSNRSRKRSLVSAVSFLLGIFLFSGGLYSWVLFDSSAAPVPVGGVAFIVGWFSMATTIGFQPRATTHND